MIHDLLWFKLCLKYRYYVSFHEKKNRNWDVWLVIRMTVSRDFWEIKLEFLKDECKNKCQYKCPVKMQTKNL